jgi:CRP-like cAMP-binding protein
LERHFRIIIQNAFIASTQRVAATLAKSAAERYDAFIEKYPQIEQRVPNHQIASYLGITPQSLSRIRSQAAERVR